MLTDLMSKTWSGLTTKEYKKHKGLTNENLRDNMTNMAQCPGGRNCHCLKTFGKYNSRPRHHNRPLRYLGGRFFKICPKTLHR